MRDAKPSTQAATQQQKATQGFRRITLNGGQSFPQPNEKVSQSGVIFSGNTRYYDDLERTMSCSSEYCLRNTLHNGVAGIADNGNLLFAINSRFNGKYATVMGAFDPFGNPIPPTLKEQNFLAGLLPNAENRLVLGTKTGNDLGVKTRDTNPSAGVYVGRNKITYDLGFSMETGKDSSIAVDGSVTTGYNRHTIQSESIGLTGKMGKDSLRLGAARSGQTKTYTVEAAMDRYFVNAKVASDGTNRNREYNIGMNVNKSVTLTATFRPDYKPPSTAPVQSYKFDPFKPEPIPDHSNAKLEVKIVF